MKTEKLLLGLAFATLIMNLVDAVATLTWIELGWATEANPVMAALLAVSPVAFMAGKLFMVGAGVSVLYHYRTRVLARTGLVSACLVYGWIVTCLHAPAAF